MVNDTVRSGMNDCCRKRRLHCTALGLRSIMVRGVRIAVDAEETDQKEPVNEEASRAYHVLRVPSPTPF